MSTTRRSARLRRHVDNEGNESTVIATPKMTPLSKDLRRVINQNSILSVKTKSKFLTDLDIHIENNNTSWRDQMRNKIIEEIISTEESYGKQLEIIIKFFMKPLTSVDYISTTERNTLFYNIESLERISKELLSQLNSDDNIGSAFISLTPYFKMYSMYAYNYNSVLQILQNVSETNKKLSSFISKQETRPEVSSKITSLLITPIQRIPRYRLLLKEVLAFTSADHPHYESIQKALEEMTSTTDKIDKLVLEQQHMTRLVEVQRNLSGGKPTIVVPGRQLLREGTLMKMSMKGNRKASACYMVLLSDMIMYCKEWKAHEKLRCERVLPISKCTVTKLVFKQGLFNLKCQNMSYILYSPTTSDEGTEWFNAIDRAIKEHQEKFQTLRKRYSSKKALKRKDMSKMTEEVSLKTKRKRKASNEDNSFDCGFHSPWKVLKLSQSFRQTESSSSSKLKEVWEQNIENNDQKPSSSTEQVVSSSSNNENNNGKSFTHTLMVQARTVVTMLGESMKRYLIPTTYISPKKESK